MKTNPLTIPEIPQIASLLAEMMPNRSIPSANVTASARRETAVITPTPDQPRITETIRSHRSLDHAQTPLAMFLDQINWRNEAPKPPASAEPEIVTIESAVSAPLSLAEIRQQPLSVFLQSINWHNTAPVVAEHGPEKPIDSAIQVTGIMSMFVWE